MKKCFSCGNIHDFAETHCPMCGSFPPLLDGFPAYAPDLSRGESAFTPEAYRDLAASEEGSFWFQARNKLICHMLRAYCGAMTSMLEIGCGTGFVLAGIRRAFPSAYLSGSEISTSGLGFAAERLPGVPLLQMDACNIPFSQEFDVIGAFDVLEHIREDEVVMAQVHAALKPKGFFLLTVPQHMWLWSTTDEAAKHIRRYSKAEVESKLDAAGFRVLRSTSFVSLLLPAMLISRKGAPRGGAAELRLPRWMNVVCSCIMFTERLLIAAGLNLPVGGSRLIVAQRVS